MMSGIPGEWPRVVLFDEPVSGRDAFVRALTAGGNDVFVGTEGTDDDGIAQADPDAKWNGSTLEWSALGTNTAGPNGWYPAGPTRYGLPTV